MSDIQARRLRDPKPWCPTSLEEARRWTAMDLDDLMITWCCLIDEGLADGLPVALDSKRLRASGPRPTLADSEAVTMEVVGEYRGVEHDTSIFASFRQRYPHVFPALVHLHRTTFVRQAANLQVMKVRRWQWVRDQIPSDPL